MNRFQSKNPGKEKSRSYNKKEQTSQQSKESAWCLDFSEGLIAVGCSTGKIEVTVTNINFIMDSFERNRIFVTNSDFLILISLKPKTLDISNFEFC